MKGNQEKENGLLFFIFICPSFTLELTLAFLPFILSLLPLLTLERLRKRPFKATINFTGRIHVRPATTLTSTFA